MWADGALWAVRETHDAALSTPRREIVRIPDDGSGAADPDAVTVVVAGSDFVAYPAPRAGRLAWIAWDHPDMPWDAAELRVGTLDEDGTVSDWVVAAGGHGATGGADVAALQPEWTGDDELLFTQDPPSASRSDPARGARWNLFVIRFDDDLTHAPAAPVYVVDGDTGGPLWSLGSRWYAALDDGNVVAVVTDGRSRLMLIEPVSGNVTELETPLTGDVQVHDVRGRRVLLTGAGASVPGGLWELDVSARSLAPLRGGEVDPASGPRPPASPMTFAGPLGPVHAFFYPPSSPSAVGLDGELPPVVVLVHGGPTGHVTGDLSQNAAFFTSRGIGVLDVNYGGSSGYGRAYRERLSGGWGLSDVQDVAAAARGLVDAGLADPARIAIKGGSAGGWTVLCALADTDVFAAGICRYGVADLRMLLAETHDFEARYLDGLVGPWPEAEAELHRALAPVAPGEPHHAASHPAGQRRPGRAAVAVGGAARRARGQRGAARLSAVRRRRARVPAVRHHREVLRVRAGLPRSGARVRNSRRQPRRPRLTTAGPELLTRCGTPRGRRRVGG